MSSGKCAGGDVTAAIDFITAGHWSFGASYYRKQFRLDYVLGTLNKPLVALLNGIVMGGGAGLSMHATFRIVTEKTIFAMPEASIGLIPDVGASHFLSRLPGFFDPWEHVVGMGLGVVFVNQLVKWDAKLQVDLDKMLDKAKAANERRYFDEDDN